MVSMLVNFYTIKTRDYIRIMEVVEFRCSKHYIVDRRSKRLISRIKKSYLTFLEFYRRDKKLIYLNMVCVWKELDIRFYVVFYCGCHDINHFGFHTPCQEKFDFLEIRFFVILIYSRKFDIRSFVLQNLVCHKLKSFSMK